MLKVYIASPYTVGSQRQNVARQIECAHRLMDLGYSPYVPLLCHFQHTVFPRKYEDWMEHTNEWLKCCDAVLRLSGESKGADKEVEEARSLGIPVYLSIESLIKDTPEYRTTRSVTK